MPRKLLSGLCAIALLAALLPLPANGMTTLDIAVNDIEAPDWSAQGIELSLDLSGSDSRAATISIKRLRLPQPVGAVRNARIQCGDTLFADGVLQCRRGSFRFSHTVLGKQSGFVAFRYDSSGAVDLTFRGASLAGGKTSGKLKWAPSSWNATLQADNLNAEQTTDLIRNWLPDFSLSANGTVSISASVDGNTQGTRSVDISTRLNAFGFSNAESTRVGEALAGDVTLRLFQADGAWNYAATVDLGAGQMYLEPFYMEVANGDLQLSADGRWDDAMIAIDNLDFNHPGVVRGSVAAHLTRGESIKIETLDVDIAAAQLPGAYDAWMQPLLIGTALDDLETRGRVSGRIQQQPDSLAVDLQIDGVSLQDRQNLFGFRDINASIKWHDKPQPLRSNASFEAGSIYTFELGTSEFAVESSGNKIRLLEPARIPVFDGAMNIARFDLHHPGGDKQRLELDAELSPVSMETVTAALSWPEMKGKLSGQVSNARFENKTLSLGGALKLRAFDGEISVNDLRLYDPLGTTPELTANVDINNLDLRSLTQTFSFGEITGKLGGHVRNLHLVAWQPARFDARLETPQGDRSRRRISQQAIDHLTRLGNGVSGALSATFLRFFEQFSYSRIGLSCTLENEVCRMGGAEAASNGYYIVKGAGLPRIDVVGFTREVAWTELVERIRNINLEAAPVIQ